MNGFVERTCTEIAAAGSKSRAETEVLSFDDIVRTEAYVLLGAPGSGKTVEFKRQARVSKSCYVTARDFITFDVRPEWRGVTLFIDGLDEVRAGSGDGRTAFDAIRRKLAVMGCPRFRLSCREADWLGSNDAHHLRAVSPDGNIRIFRLSPLSAEDVRKVLRQKLAIEQPEAFIASAREHGVDGLLVNPHSLDLLAKATEGAEWPISRTETFEMACITLLRDPNEEHRNAEPEGADMAAVMLAAGKLCAVQLLTGSAGFVRLSCGHNTDYVALDDIPGENRRSQKHALGSKLFTSPDGSRAFPVHPQIAEFLAARYLASVIYEGLPLGRILALMTGFDGAVVTDLRGLSAWVAAHSKANRRAIIRRDPLGTVLYGDVGRFSVEEKIHILRQLDRAARKNPWFVRMIELESRFGDVVSPGMEDALLGLLSDPGRDDIRQSVVLIVVEMLTHGEPLQVLADPVLGVIRDARRWPRIRHAAMDAFIRQRADKWGALTELKALAGEVFSGAVSDPDDDLLGGLLARLYPDALPGAEVLQYLRAPKKPNQLLAYEYFWIGQLPKRSSCSQIAQLLDELAVRQDWLNAEIEHSGPRASLLRRLPPILLDSFLARYDADVEPTRLFDWLGIAGWVGDWGYETRIGLKARTRIRSWLSERADVWKSILELGLERCIELVEQSEAHSFKQLMWMETERRLFGASLPPDFGSWCLQHALATEHRAAAAWLMYSVANAVHRGAGKDVTREEVNESVARNALLKEALKERMAYLKKGDNAGRETGELTTRSSRKRPFDLQARVRVSETELRENRAEPAMLHELAKAYLGGFGNVRGHTPKDRLSFLLGDDEDLVETVLAALRATLARDDLPSDEEVISLGTRNRVHYLSLPVLAGLDELAQGEPDGGLSLNDSQTRLALALHYNVSVWPRSWEEADKPPEWLPPWIRNRPEAVADILVLTAKARLRKGFDFSQHLYDLAHSSDQSAVARIAALPILSAFPVRCGQDQLSTLRHLLLAACVYAERGAFVELMEKRLEYKSMNIPQRVYWLAAGLIVDPASYVGRLESFVTGNQRRVRYLGQFISSRFDTPRNLIQSLNASAMSMLIRVMGGVYRPYSVDSSSDRGCRVTPGMEGADRVHGLINQLATDASKAASEDLESLAEDDRLVPWRSHLLDAGNRQAGIRRETEFRHGRVREVLEVLDNGRPANVSDLAALTMAYVREIATEIRDGSTSDWRQYWSFDALNRRPERPKPENECRNALLSDLRHRLQRMGVNAWEEGRYANDTRADVTISFRDFKVPVETKRSCHPELWSGVRKQLIAKYSRDPGADGHGIYLVFWFGSTVHCRPTPGVGGTPISAHQLKKRLLEELSVEERTKISVCVIDVSIED